MTANRYLIHLEQGDNDYYFVVGPASWAFIHEPRPTFDATCSATETIPPAVVSEFRFPEDVELQCNVTTGSYENDRVLALLEGFSHYEKRPRGPFVDVYAGYVY